MSDLERTISMFRQQQPQVPQIPQFPAVSQAPAMQGFDFQKILAVMSAQNRCRLRLLYPKSHKRNRR